MYIEWGISYSSSDCFLINIWEVPNFQQPTSEYECVSKPSGTTPPNLPKSVLLKIKRFLIEAKYQQQAAFNVLLPPKKKHTKNDCLRPFPISPTNLCVFQTPGLGWWVTCQLYGSFLARAKTFLERSTFSGVFDTKKKDDRQGEGATVGRSLLERWNCHIHWLYFYVFLYWIWIDLLYIFIYIYNIFLYFLDIVFSWKVKIHWEIWYPVRDMYCIYDTCITPQMLLKLPQGAAGWSSSP